MRVWILALSVLAVFPGILVSADTAVAGPSMTPRAVTAAPDPAADTEEATRETEDKIGLNKQKRRDVQLSLIHI